MKRMISTEAGRERERIAYRRETEDRLKNYPTFDPVTGHMVCQMYFFEQR